MPIKVILGLQWGDEGKGKWLDQSARAGEYIARFQGGDNAGHTIKIKDQKHVLHLLPSAAFKADTKLVLLGDMVINPVKLLEEIEITQKYRDLNQNLWISPQAHVITPADIAKDQKDETIGTTKRGIGPCYEAKAARHGLRMGTYVDPAKLKTYLQQLSYPIEDSIWEEFLAAAEKLQQYVINVETKLRQELKNGASLIFEGAQGTMLDLSHGTYPYVTSSNTISAAAPLSLGIDPRKINHVIGISKAYCTRVGNGPFPSELNNTIGQALGQIGQEFGATTKRPRRCGWLDTVALAYSCAINGVDSLIINKVDVLNSFKEIGLATAYQHPKYGKIHTYEPEIIEDCEAIYEYFPGWQSELTSPPLPKNLTNFLERIEELCECSITALGTGPEREDYIILKN